MIRKTIVQKGGGAPRVLYEQWPELTASDVKHVAVNRSAVARQVAKHYHIPVRQAKKAVNDFLVFGGESGKKRVRKRFERGVPGSTIERRGHLVVKVGNFIVEAKSAGGLAGEGGTRPDR